MLLHKIRYLFIKKQIINKIKQVNCNKIKVKSINNKLRNKKKNLIKNQIKNNKRNNKNRKKNKENDIFKDYFYLYSSFN